MGPEEKPFTFLTLDPFGLKEDRFIPTPPPRAIISIMILRLSRIPSLESFGDGITKQLKYVTSYPVPAPARIRPPGRNLNPSITSWNFFSQIARVLGFSTEAIPLATLLHISEGSFSIALPALSFKEYLSRNTRSLIPSNFIYLIIPNFA